MVVKKLRGRFKLWKLLCAAVCLCFAFALLLGIRVLFAQENSSSHFKIARKGIADPAYDFIKHPRNILPVINRRHKKIKHGVKKVNGTTNNVLPPTVSESPHQVLDTRDTGTRIAAELPNYSVHAFYYPWYSTADHDGKFSHWNHRYIPHWDQKKASSWRTDFHKPPEDIGASFYPALGLYSSGDTQAVEQHMQMMLEARIGVVAVSWYPPQTADQEETVDPDSLMSLILDAANKYNLKVVLHIEPYKGRNGRSMRDNIRYILDNYGNHPAFYRRDHKNKKNLPLFYVYDSYLVEAGEWRKLLTPGGAVTVRDTDLDGIFIGLVADKDHQNHIVTSGFDGFYTYFAASGFTFGSTWKNWRKLASFANRYKLLFIPSVGPGYIDTEVRPWNAANIRKRDEGKYYDSSFRNALAVSPSIISITSFNEWHEGTQIEPAVPKSIPERKYEDYGPQGPKFYLKLTRQWVDKLSASSVYTREQ